MSIESAAAFSAAHTRQQVATQVGLKAVQLANQQQENVLSLLDAAVESIDDAQAMTDNPGSRIDIRA